MGNINRTATLKLSLLDDFSKRAGLIGAAARKLNAQFRAFNVGMAAASADFSRAALGLAAIGYALSRPIGAAMEYESAMADVRKVSDFSADGLKAFGGQLLEMSKSIPMAATDLATLAAAAAQAGIQTRDLAKFTEAAAKAATAFDIPAADAGDSMAKIGNAAGLSVDGIIQLNDALNALSNSQASSAADLIDFEKRVAGAGRIAGFSAEQMAAFGSAMVAAGAEPEVAATSFRNLTRALTIGTGATKAQRAAYRALGLEASKVSADMQRDAVATTNDVLARIGRLPKDKQGALISALFGDEARAVPGLIANGKLLAEALDVISDRIKYAGSVEKEFQARIDTTAAKLDILKNRATALGIEFGRVLLPMIGDMSDAFGPLIDRVAAFVRANKEMVLRVSKVVVGMAAFRLAISAARLAAYTLVRPTNLLLAALGGLAYLNFDKLDDLARYLARVGTAFSESAFGAAFMKSFAESIGTMADGASRAAKALADLVGPGTWLGEWLNSAAGGNWGATLGAVAAGLAALGVAAGAIAAVSGPVRVFANAVLLLSGIKPAWALVRWLRGLSAASAALGGAAGAAGAGGAAAGAGWAWLSQIGPWASSAARALGAFGAAYAGYQAGTMLGKGAVELGSVAGGKYYTPADQAEADDLRRQRDDIAAQIAKIRAESKVPEMAETLVRPLQDQLDQLDARLRSFDEMKVRPQVDPSSIDSAISKAGVLRGMLSGLGGSTSTPTNTGAFGGPRANGGPVKSGLTYLVGEQGPELFTPGRSGAITPNSAARASAGGLTIHAPVTISIRGAGAEDIAKAAEAAARKVVNQISEAGATLLRRSAQVAFAGTKIYGDT